MVKVDADTCIPAFSPGSDYQRAEGREWNLFQPVFTDDNDRKQIPLKRNNAKNKSQERKSFHGRPREPQEQWVASSYPMAVEITKYSSRLIMSLWGWPIPMQIAGCKNTFWLSCNLNYVLEMQPRGSRLDGKLLIYMPLLIYCWMHPTIYIYIRRTSKGTECFTLVRR